MDLIIMGRKKNIEDLFRLIIYYKKASELKLVGFGHCYPYQRIGIPHLSTRSVDNPTLVKNVVVPSPEPTSVPTSVPTE
jgi:hypothetical protein